MHKFENSWLYKREKIDHSSKNLKIIDKINSTIKDLETLNVLDLGTGTGSNFRFLSKKIKHKNQSWTLMDISRSSLSEARKNTILNNKIRKVSLKHNDIIKDIKKTNFNQFDLVTGSAFLDIMPHKWFKDFHRLNQNTKIIYFSINYDGYFKFQPHHSLDNNMLQLFNNDQQSKKDGIVKAVGPDCSEIIKSYFSKTHKTFLLNSNWIDIKNKKFQLMFLDFCKNVINNNKTNTLDKWIEFKKEKILKNKSKLNVFNKDFLAIKI